MARPAPPPSAPRPDGGPAVLVLTGRLDRAGIPPLVERLRALLRERGGGTVLCDVGGLEGAPDAVLIDALARLQLTARRHGGRIRLCGAGSALRGLLALTGLGELPGLGFEAGGEAEQREEPFGVEEGVEPGDPAV
ncbi:STAS domain-containing protein [Streptomyces sp. NPDC026673]|uniref:STAS domain-containing protein n=1 Tax=Streptomyces sp. NPDC026673 TaxID=3155724 RepID=UPI0033EFF44A